MVRMMRFLIILIIHVHPTEKDNRSLVETLKCKDFGMSWVCPPGVGRLENAWLERSWKYSGRCLGCSKS